MKETNRLERWLSYFSKKTTVKELEEIAMVDPAIQKAFKVKLFLLKMKLIVAVMNFVKKINVTELLKLTTPSNRL